MGAPHTHINLKRVAPTSPTITPATPGRILFQAQSIDPTTPHTLNVSADDGLTLQSLIVQNGVIPASAGTKTGPVPLGDGTIPVGINGTIPMTASNGTIPAVMASSTAKGSGTNPAAVTGSVNKTAVPTATVLHSGTITGPTGGGIKPTASGAVPKSQSSSRIISGVVPAAIIAIILVCILLLRRQRRRDIPQPPLIDPYHEISSMEEPAVHTARQKGETIEESHIVLPAKRVLAPLTRSIDHLHSQQ